MADRGTAYTHPRATAWAVDAGSYRPGMVPVASPVVAYMHPRAAIMGVAAGYSIAGTQQSEVLPYPGFPTEGVIWPPSWLNPGD